VARSIANPCLKARAAAVFAALAVAATAQTAGRAPASGQTPAPSDADPLYEAGKALFDQFAPAAVKEQYEFPSPAQWNGFAAQLQQALNGESLETLGSFAPQGRAALSTLRAAGLDDDLADWLEQRLDEVEGARDTTPTTPTTPLATRPRRPGSPPAPSAAPAPPSALTRIPHYSLWTARVEDRPVPARAAALMPTLRKAFAAEGVPPALAWVAEAESSFNPNARSPAGARGLYQLMPATAQRFGLDTFLPDERTDPGKSAHAAARYLHALHEKFHDWPLAFAAYNAGEGRVARALTAKKAKDFGAIADTLPAETRMYVPKVCALIATRTGEDVTAL